MKKVLLVDDDSDLVNLLEYSLRRAGFSVVTAPDGAKGLQSWEAEHPDLVLLERQLPQVDGLEVCRRIREQTRTPIIFVSGWFSEAHVLAGLEAGADDYISKPFSTKQLLARIQAVLRRYEPDPDQVAAREFSVADLTLDPETHEVTRETQPIALTPLEFCLLYCLAVNVGQIVPYARLIEAGWGYGIEPTTDLLKTHMTHLRRKLGFAGRSASGIQAQLGIGYRLNLSVTVGTLGFRPSDATVGSGSG